MVVEENRSMAARNSPFESLISYSSWLEWEASAGEYGEEG